MGGAGDEVADVLEAGERWHGLPIGDGAVRVGEDEAPYAELRLNADALEGVAAAGDGGIFGGGEVERGWRWCGVGGH